MRHCESDAWVFKQLLYSFLMLASLVLRVPHHCWFTVLLVGLIINVFFPFSTLQHSLSYPKDSIKVLSLQLKSLLLNFIQLPSYTTTMKVFSFTYLFRLDLYTYTVLNRPKPEKAAVQQEYLFHDYTPNRYYYSMKLILRY